MQNPTQTANQLIKRHGDAAPEVAASHIAECDRKHNDDEHAFWSTVMVETKVLLARDFGW